MRLLMSLASAMVLATALGGCSNPTAPRSAAGIWNEDKQPPGSLLEITLILNGSDISGSGAWCGEALGCGVTTETGTVSGNKVHIVTTFDNGRVETFDGVLVSDSSMVGTAWVGNAQVRLVFDQSFTRVNRDPPG